MSENEKMTDKSKDNGEIVRQSGIARISWAWLFPILAAAATAWLFWSNWKSEGPRIEILFNSAPGIQAGKTPLIYRGVTAGVVKGLHLDKELDKVVVVVRLKAFAAELAREGTVFWIDQPVVGLGETSGLDALIQGNSLQARMGTGPEATRFEGASQMPLEPLDSPALSFQLRARNIPFLDRGSPIYYRGIAVGVIESKSLDEKGNPYLHAVIDHGYAHVMKSTARFWPVPATTLKVGPGGVKLDVMALKTVLLGGVEFDVFDQSGGTVKDGEEFELSPDQFSAKASGTPVQVTFRNGQGLQAGQTEVRYLGVPIGLVSASQLNAANQSVETQVRFQPAFDHLHTEGAVFTLVRPQISLTGVSDIETLVSGVYINIKPGKPGALVQSFRGESNTDGFGVPDDGQGLRLTLQAKTLPPIGIGAPVLHRGIPVGEVVSLAMDAEGRPTLALKIQPAYAGQVAGNSRFWIVPGVSVQAGPGMLNLDIAGVQSLMKGGVAFEVFGEPKGLAENGAKYELFTTEPAARAISAPVRIAFDNGQGLLAGQTQLRYLGTPVGLVDHVETKSGRVVATVRFDDGYDFLRREGSAFSVVRLNVSLNGVSGLETVVSGVYIECVPSEGGKLSDKFTGVSLTEATFEEEKEEELEVIVTTSQTNIAIGAPVTYRGLTVGEVGRKVLRDGGRRVGLGVLVKKPYAGLVRVNSKFWNAGGLKVGLSFFAISVQTGSLDSLAKGGVAFATPNEGEMGAPARAGQEYELYPSPRKEWLKWSPEIPVGN